jgi:4-amino-4-deoxy-L-arabinose transferase-like glycosyltransferase
VTFGHPPVERRVNASRWIPAAIVLAVTACWLAWSPLGANDLVGGDEGYYGTMARNVLAAPRYLLHPSLQPLGPPGDKPPLYPALLALSMRAFGPTESALRWLSILAAACTALCLAGLVRRATGPWTAAAAAAFLVCLPYFANGSRVVAAELPLTALGSAGLLCASGGVSSKGRAFVAGALLGAAFLCKLWLVVLIGLPVLSLFWPLRRERAAALAVLVVTAAAVASLHLVAVACFDPRSLGHWGGIYLSRSLTERAGGAGYAAYWLKPPWYYGQVLAHAFILLLPLIALGVVAALRRLREPVPRALLVWAGGTILLSLFAVKAHGYAYVVVPAWAGLAALGAHALAAWPRKGAVGVAVALAVAASVLGLAREAQRLPFRYHVPGYRAVAAAVAPLLEDVPPARTCFIGPEAPALSFYLFRTGSYWGTPYVPWTAGRRRELMADTALRVFVVDPQQVLYGGWPDSAMVVWLESSTTEITAAIARRADRPLALRVFVRGAADPLVSAPPPAAPGVVSVPARSR